MGHLRSARGTRLTDVSSDLLAGALLSLRTRADCNKTPNDFTDEKTLGADQPHEAVLVLRLVK